MAGTRKTAVISYKELSDSESDTFKHRHPTDLKRRKRKKNKKLHVKNVAPTEGTLTKSITPPWAVFPLDIIHEIFRWLQPIDLLQLARSTRTLRNHLMSKVSLSLWKSSRRNVLGGAPECPEYMSEPAFAQLLFSDECFVCGKKTNWMFWEVKMRCCNECFSGRKFPEIDNTSLVKELLPGISGGGSRRRYYIPAIYEIATAIEDHENRTLARVPGAEEAFEEFKMMQKNKVTAMLKDVPVYERWKTTHENLVRARDQELRAKREGVFTTKLLAEGHDPLDIHSAFYAFDTREELTEDGWNAIRRDVAKFVARRKNDRLEWARKSLVNDRRAVAVTVLTAHPIKANIGANAFSPSLREVASGFEPIRLVVDREDNDEVTAEDFDGVLEGVEEWVDEWRIKKRMDLLEIMVSAGAAAIADPPTEQDFSRLKLATTMFSCKTPLGLRRCEQAGGGLMCFTLLGRHSWRCRTFRRCRSSGFPWYTECLRYSKKAEEMIRQLVVAAGLDPETTTADEMDGLNARFYCQGCPKWDGLPRSWRNCAAHFQEHPFATFQGWVVVPPVDKIKIIRREIHNMADAGCRLKCSLHHHEGYESASSFQRHLRFFCRSHPESGELNFEDVLFDPLVPPQPISLDGRTSESMPPPVPPSNEISKSSHRRRRRRK
ncbi:hypothetical protein FRB93_006761 [Tulasnella sp. JGI-2019a]|nr:hypothetical protein FRB93_006761 [Tulasnella sp. JGI-2019a]